MISYYELLGLVKEGKQPKLVEYKSLRYAWDNGEYYRGPISEKFNNLVIKGQSTDGLIFEKNIKVLPPHKLEGEDKIDLENTLKPYKNKIKSIIKGFIPRDENRNVLRIKIKHENKKLKLNEIEIAIEENTYKGVYLGVEYTPEELGLWEGE